MVGSTAGVDVVGSTTRARGHGRPTRRLNKPVRERTWPQVRLDGRIDAARVVESII
jgi:hypothetical protein